MKPFHISNDFKILNLSLFLKKENVLIISDLHIGYEEALNKQGILIPRFSLQDSLKQLKEIIGKKRFDRIIINGDLKHEFGTVSNQEWRDTKAIATFLKEKTKKLILVKGNHDTILTPMKKFDVEIVKEIRIGDILIVHGDKIPEDIEKIKTIIIGHEHPAISLRDNSRVERFKCFLIGTFKGKRLIVMPSFNPVLPGSDVLKDKMLSPLLTNVDDFEVIVVDKEVLEFGKIKVLKGI